uniref:FBD domain-containing protein n=1 Tax=Arundo donax TaxID=35708 RepID=A0A0A9AD65_ARUDO
MMKVMNFDWHRVKVQLVTFLLRNASSLQKLLLVSPNVYPHNVTGIQEADLLLVQEALANGKIILRESDAAATGPFHSEVFLEI